MVSLMTLVLGACISADIEQKQGAIPEGEVLIKQYCYPCHKQEAGPGRLAPPMAYVKEHYWEDDITEQEFSKKVYEFVKNPSKSKARMSGAIGNFGLMPKQVFPDDTLKTIIKYIYDTELKEPR